MKPDYIRKGEWLELRQAERISADSGVLHAFLLETLSIPPSLIKKLERTAGIRAEGNRLLLRLFPRERAAEEGEWADLRILFEDDFCLVVWKPAGMPVHASVPGQRGTLAHAVASYYEQEGQQCRIRHIHRLDEDTTGPVLYAKNEYAHLLLDAAMREKKIKREYAALAQGRFERDSGVIDEPIGRDRHHPKRRRVSPTGDPARTRYRVMERAEWATYVRLDLETGRTHQIRVHLSHMGHPLIGDGLYGGSAKLFPRQALHGESLTFVHPWTGEETNVEAPWPEDFARLWERLKEGARP